MQTSRVTDLFYVECETLDAPNGDFKYRRFVRNPESETAVHFASRDAAEQAMYQDAHECTERGENTIYSVRSVNEMLSADYILKGSSKYQVRKTIKGLNPSLGPYRQYIEGSWVEDSWLLSQGDRFSSTPLLFESQKEAEVAIAQDIEALPKDPEAAGFSRHAEGVWERDPWIPTQIDRETFYHMCAHALMTHGVAYREQTHDFVQRSWVRGESVARKAYISNILMGIEYFRLTEEGRALLEPNPLKENLGSTAALASLISPLESVILLPEVKVSDRFRVEYVIYPRPPILSTMRSLEV